MLFRSRQKLAKHAAVDRGRLERRLAQNRREHERIIDMIARGDEIDIKVIGARSKALGAEEREIEAKLAAVPEVEPLITLHPRVLARYETLIGRLAEAVSAGARSGDPGAPEAIRDLVSKVIVSRDEARLGGVVVEIEGRLNALLGEKAFPNKVRGVWRALVAEDRYMLSPPWVTFRSFVA